VGGWGGSRRVGGPWALPGARGGSCGMRSSAQASNREAEKASMSARAQETGIRDRSPAAPSLAGTMGFGRAC